MANNKEKFSKGFLTGVVYCLALYSLFGAVLSYNSFRTAPSDNRRWTRSGSSMGAGPPHPAPISILDVEEKYNIEILHPTVRELQQHINRHGGLRGKFIKVDDWYETETKKGAKLLRCNQEAITMFARMENKQ